MREMEKIFENEPYEYEHIIGDEDVFLMCVEDEISSFAKESILDLLEKTINEFVPVVVEDIWNKAKNIQFAINTVIEEGGITGVESINEILTIGIERYYYDLACENLNKIIWNCSKDYFEIQYYDNNLNISDDVDIETMLEEMIVPVGIYSKASEIMEIVDNLIDILGRIYGE